MKTNTLILLSLLLLFSITTVRAKDSSSESEEATPKGFKFTVASLGLGRSFYTPDLSYWNERSEMRFWDTKFTTMDLWGGNIEFGLINHLHLRAEGSYSTATARQTVVPAALGGGTQSKTLTLIPVSGFLLYDFSDEIVVPYIGGGAGTVFVNSDNELAQQTVASSKSSATDYMYYAVGGVRMPFGKNLFVGVEARGAFGGYQETVMDTHHVASVQNISLNGFQMAVTVNYKF